MALKDRIILNPFVAGSLTISRNLAVAATAWGLVDNPASSIILGGTATSAIGLTQAVTETYYRDFSTITTLLTGASAFLFRVISESQATPEAGYCVLCMGILSTALTMVEASMTGIEVSTRG